MLKTIHNSRAIGFRILTMPLRKREWLIYEYAYKLSIPQFQLKYRTHWILYTVFPVSKVSACVRFVFFFFRLFMRYLIRFSPSSVFPVHQPFVIATCTAETLNSEFEFPLNVVACSDSIFIYIYRRRMFSLIKTQKRKTHATHIEKYIKLQWLSPKVQSRAHERMCTH